MRTKEMAQTVANMSPSSATTAVGANLFKGDMLRRAEKLVIDADLLAGAGGTLDVYLQRRTASNPNVWRDWIHFPQLTAAQAKKFTVTITGEGSSIVEVGGGNDASPGVALAANAAVNVIPGDDVRVVFVAGASTSAGATNTVTITPYSERVA